jgi:hypothetical protein
MIFKDKPKFSTKRFIILFLFIDAVLICLHWFKPFIVEAQSSVVYITINTISTFFSYFCSFTFAKQPKEVDEVKLGKFVDDKDQEIKKDLIAENQKLILANQTLSEKVHTLNSTFESRVQERIRKERDEFNQNERIKNQSSF